MLLDNMTCQEYEDIFITHYIEFDGIIYVFLFPIVR